MFKRVLSIIVIVSFLWSPCAVYAGVLAAPGLSRMDVMTNVSAALRYHSQNSL